MITIFYIIKTILYFHSLGFSLNARPHNRQRSNHYRVDIKVVVLYCIVAVILSIGNQEKNCSKSNLNVLIWPGRANIT